MIKPAKEWSSLSMFRRWEGWSPVLSTLSYRRSQRSELVVSALSYCKSGKLLSEYSNQISKNKSSWLVCWSCLIMKPCRLIIMEEMLQWSCYSIDADCAGCVGFSCLPCYSFRDESDQSFQADIMLLAAGIAIIICYVAVIMGKFNEVEHKVTPLSPDLYPPLSIDCDGHMTSVCTSAGVPGTGWCDWNRSGHTRLLRPVVCTGAVLRSDTSYPSFPPTWYDQPSTLIAMTIYCLLPYLRCPF